MECFLNNMRNFIDGRMTINESIDVIVIVGKSEKNTIFKLIVVVLISHRMNPLACYTEQNLTHKPILKSKTLICDRWSLNSK